jgi:hypothetical protein
LVAIIPLGGFYLQARDAAQPTIIANLQPFAAGDNGIDVTAYVIREGLLRDSPYGGKQESVDVETEQLRIGEQSIDTAVGIRLTIYSKQTEEDEARDGGVESPLRIYTYGQRLHLVAKLRMPRDYRNPGAMDMAGYLSSQGIRLTGSARASTVEVLPGCVGSRIGRLRSTARRSVLTHIMLLWPGERGALMQAALIGGRAFVGRDIKTEFQRTGTYHILVVSGINVGILAFAVFWGLRKLPFGETWATIVPRSMLWESPRWVFCWWTPGPYSKPASSSRFCPSSRLPASPFQSCGAPSIPCRAGSGTSTRPNMTSPLRLGRRSFGLSCAWYAERCRT